MNWFDILKNQIASTKGKQFQLDFNQPMIEDDDCKKTLMAISERILAKTSVDGFTLKENRIRESKEFLMYPDYKNYFENPKVQLRTFRLDFLQKVPEEVCCKALELYKLMPNDSKKIIEFDGYTIAAGKNNQRKSGSYFSCSTYLEIHEGTIEGSNYENWFFSILCSTKNEEHNFDNFLTKTCEKLTKELVKL